MRPTIYVDLGAKSHDNPIARSIKAVAFGADSVEQLESGDMEASIAVTNSIATALRMAKETEKTSIVLVYFNKVEREEARVFASRYPDRVTAVSVVSSSEGEIGMVPFLLNLIAKKTEEV